MTVEPAIFTCSICGEPSMDICAYCTKDACANHRCERCKRCSDCCECEVPLSAQEAHPEPEPVIEAPAPLDAPLPLSAEPPVLGEALLGEDVPLEEVEFNPVALEPRPFGEEQREYARLEDDNNDEPEGETPAF